LDDELLGELNEIVALANAGNRLVIGYQVPVDEVFASKQKATHWKKPKTAKKIAKSAVKKAKSKKVK